MKKRRWLWITLFVLGAGLLFALGTTWNVALFEKYSELVASARELTRREIVLSEIERRYWLNLVLGTAGFVLVLVVTSLLFVRLLREMKLNQLQSEFLARVSHELKSPVTSLELTASLLRLGPSSEAEAEKLWTIHGSELLRLKVEIELLLEAARLETGGLHPQWTHFDLETWVEDSLHRWRQILGANGGLVREGDPLRAPVRLDARLLDLVANNLLDNARKFARDGRPRVTLRSRVLSPHMPGQGARWELEFLDEGVGFDPREAGRIFRRFYRAKSAGPVAIPGTGLGLFLAAAACRTLRLEIEASSAGPGRGASFKLRGYFEESA